MIVSSGGDRLPTGTPILGNWLPQVGMNRDNTRHPEEFQAGGASSNTRADVVDFTGSTAGRQKSVARE